MIQVYVKNGDIQGALKELKKKIKKAGVFEELQAREHFIPKSQKRKMKSAAARRRK